MKTPFLRLGCAFVLSALVAPAAETPVRVAASRELRVAVVDTTKATPARDALHQAFATALADAVGERSGSPLGVRVKLVGADQAAFNLEAGVYDAVFVPSHALPRPLLGSTVARLSAKRGAGDKEKNLFLVYNPGDAKLAELLAVSFPAALDTPKFLQALEAMTKPVLVAQRD